jgi:hypothetical protein
MADSRTQKSFSASTSTLLMTSCLSQASLRWESDSRRCASCSIHLCTGLSIADIFTDTNRPIPSSHPSCAYSVESRVRASERQTNPKLSLLKPGGHSNWTLKFVSPPSVFFRLHIVLVTNVWTLLTARFGTHSSRRTRTHLTAAVHTGRHVQLEQCEPARPHRNASTGTRPPS